MSRRVALFASFLLFASMLLIPGQAAASECPPGQVAVTVAAPVESGGGREATIFISTRVCVDVELPPPGGEQGDSQVAAGPCSIDPASIPCLSALRLEFQIQDRCENAREAGLAGAALEPYCGAAGATATPPTAAQIVETAIGSLELPAPALEFGPDKDLVAVKYPVWLWIENGADRSASVPLGAFVVTATATLKSVTWDMGEPIDVAKPWIKPAPVVCNGPGTAPPPSVNELEMPDCGYIFNWKSLPERTDGVGAWTVTVTANWEVTIESNSGYTDVIEVPTTNSDTVVVGEWNVVIVPGPGG